MRSTHLDGDNMRALTDGERRLLALERIWADVPGADIGAATDDYRRLVNQLAALERAAARREPILWTAPGRKRHKRRRPIPVAAI